MFWRISLPLIAANLADGRALLGERMFGDLTASAILADTNNPVLVFGTLEIFEINSSASLVALLAVLTLVSMFVLVVLLLFALKH